MSVPLPPSSPGSNLQLRFGSRPASVGTPDDSGVPADSFARTLETRMSASEQVSRGHAATPMTIPLTEPTVSPAPAPALQANTGHAVFVSHDLLKEGTANTAMPSHLHELLSPTPAAPGEERTAGQVMQTTSAPVTADATEITTAPAGSATTTSSTTTVSTASATVAKLPAATTITAGATPTANPTASPTATAHATIVTAAAPPRTAPSTASGASATTGIEATPPVRQAAERATPPAKGTSKAANTSEDLTEATAAPPPEQIVLAGLPAAIAALLAGQTDARPTTGGSAAACVGAALVRQPAELAIPHAKGMSKTTNTPEDLTEATAAPPPEQIVLAGLPAAIAALLAGHAGSPSSVVAEGSKGAGALQLADTGRGSLQSMTLQQGIDLQPKNGDNTGAPSPLQGREFAASVMTERNTTDTVADGMLAEVFESVGANVPTSPELAHAHGTMHLLRPSHAAQPASPHLPIATPTGEAGWAEEVGDQVRWMLGRAESKAELVLTPPNMGKLEVSINLNGDQTTAQFIASSQAARDALERALPQLREALQQAGILLGDANVSTSGQNHEGDGRENGGRGGRDEHGEAGSGDSTGPGSRSVWQRQQQGMVDTFA